MPETLQTAEEEKLLSSIKTATDLVDAKGMSPDEAIAKVAQDEKYSPGMISVLARAYNTGRQLGQWRTEGSVLDKLASYTLADPEKIISLVYPSSSEKEKTAFDHDYRRPPDWLPDERRDEILSRSIPQLLKTAGESICAACGNAPCTCEKVCEGEAKDRMKKAYSKYQRAKTASEEDRRRVSDLQDMLLLSANRLTQYFKHASYDRLPFAQVEFAARRLYGPASEDFLKLAYERAKLKEEKALPEEKLQQVKKLPDIYKRAVDERCLPLTIVREGMELAKELLSAREKASLSLESFKKIAKETGLPFVKRSDNLAEVPGRSQPTTNEDGLSILKTHEKVGFGFASEVGAIAAGDILGGMYLHSHGLEGKKKKNEDEEEDPLEGPRADAISKIKEQARKVKAEKKSEDLEKASILGVAFGNALGNSFSRGVGQVPKTKDDLIEDEWLKLEDPKHENELRKIRAHAMLNSMLTDPEDPISGYDPDKVIAAYNELSQAAPRASENAAVLKPLLRKRLAGHTEPFEAKELIDIEKGVKDTTAPSYDTNKLMKAPPSIMG